MPQLHVPIRAIPCWNAHKTQLGKKSISVSPERTRIGRWSPEPPGTEWPALHFQTGDCRSSSGGNHSHSWATAESLTFDPTLCCTYVDGGDAGIGERRRPLGRDAHFHIAESLPRCMQQHITVDAKTYGTRSQQSQNNINIFHIWLHFNSIFHEHKKEASTSNFYMLCSSTDTGTMTWDSGSAVIKD